MTDLSGKVFADWTVIGFSHFAVTSGVRKKRIFFWDCRCKCGNIKKVRGVSLTTGLSSSCRRCIMRTHGVSTDPAYRAWISMKTRCYSASHKSYHRYGGRGITVCPQWLDNVQQFIADMGAMPSPKHQIDRIDNDLGYFPENCRWVTCRENSRNRSSSNLITYQGKTQCLQAWADDLGINRITLGWRIRQGWPVERALRVS